MSPAYLNLSENRRIAYRKTEGKGPCAVFFPGFKSDMQGSKAVALEEFCRARGQACLRFDYTGHGESSGDFEQGTIGQWLRDALDVIDTLTTGPLLLVASSMGGWLATLAARERPERVTGLVTLAAAPDFTEKLIWDAFPPAMRAELMEKGRIPIANCYDDQAAYVITRQLVEEGRNHLLLHAPIPVTCPVRLIHGTADADVPWQFSQMLMEKLASPDATLTLVKGASHRLSEPENLARMFAAVAELL